MKITNKHGLPEALHRLCENNVYGFSNKSYSVTTLLNDPKYILLSKRHFDEIEQDCADMMNLVLGTAVHSLIEKFDTTGYAEKYLRTHIRDGYYLTGKCDLYDATNFTLIDYKTASVYKIMKSDFNDWKLQGLMYAWLLRKEGCYVDKLKFHAILKDWTPREKRKTADYPETQVYTWEYHITTQDMEDIEIFIYSKFNDLIKYENTPDDEIPYCSDESTWFSGNKYAVYKSDSDTRAVRVFDNRIEAEGYIANKLGGNGHIIFRKGEYIKCDNYCNCCEFCKKGGVE